MQLARADGQGTELVVHTGDVRTHLAQRLDDASHRTLLDGRVTGERYLEGLTGQNTRDQTGGCTAVASVQALGGLLETVQTDTVYSDRAVVTDLDRHTHLAEAVDGGQTILAHQEAGDVGHAVGQRAQHDRAVRDRLVTRHRDRAVQAGGRM